MTADELRGEQPAARGAAAPARSRTGAPDTRAGWTAGGRLLLVLILALAAGLRFAGLSFGLDADDPSHTVLNNQVDERSMAQSVLDGLLAGRLDPGDFLFRGPGGFLVFGALDAAVLLPSALAHPGGWEGLRADLDRNLSRLILWHRTWSALAGVATVLVLAQLVRRRMGQTAGLLAALFTATFYLHVRESHFGTMDPLFGLLFTGTLAALLQAAADGTRRSFLRAGLLAGATASIKYFGGALVLHALLALLVARRRAGAQGRPAPPWTLLAWTGAAMAAGFLLLAPSVWLDPRPLADKVIMSVDSFGMRPSAGSLGELVRYHARLTAGYGLGAPLCALALCGLLAGLLRRGPLRLPALFALLALPCALAVDLPALRYGLPVLLAGVPLAAGTAAGLLAPLLARPGPAPRAVAAAALAACLLPGTRRCVDFDARVARTDTRLLMLDRLAALGAPREDIWALGGFGLPRLPEGLPSPFLDIHRMLVRDRGLLTRMADDPPRYVLQDLSAPDLREWTGVDVEPLLASRYREIARYDPRPDPDAVPLDVFREADLPQHVFPFRDPGAVDRPGPPLVLYELCPD